jgi:hypothetical protein
MAVIIKFFALPVLDVIHQKKDVNDLQLIRKLYPLCVYVFLKDILMIF